MHQNVLTTNSLLAPTIVWVWIGFRLHFNIILMFLCNVCQYRYRILSKSGFTGNQPLECRRYVLTSLLRIIKKIVSG